MITGTVINAKNVTTLVRSVKTSIPTVLRVEKAGNLMITLVWNQLNAKNMSSWLLTENVKLVLTTVLHVPMKLMSAPLVKRIGSLLKTKSLVKRLLSAKKAMKS